MSEPAISPSGELLYKRLASLMEQDEAYGWFGRYLCDAIMGMLQGLDQIVLDTTIGGRDYPGWCSLAAPAVCPEAWLDWCATLYGVPLSPGISPAAKRAAIAELPPQKRGGIEAMRKAAEATYPAGGGFAIHFIEQAAGNAYRIVATTTPEQTASQEAVTRTAILAQKPAGINLIYSSSPIPMWEAATKRWEEVGGTVTWDSVKTGEV